MKIYYLHEGDFIPKYIGSTNQKLMLRKNNHWQDLRNKTEKVEWIKKLKHNGGKLYIELIEDCKDEERYIREAYWIKKHKSTIINTKVANLHTESHKAYMSLIMKKPKSKTARLNIAKAQMKKAKKVYIDGQVYNSIHDASRETGISTTVISFNCNKKRKSKTHNIKFV